MTETTNQLAPDLNEKEQESSFLNIQFFAKTFLLNWQWILLSVFICLCVAFIYIRYTSPVYQVTAKLLVKEDDDNKSRMANQIQAAANLGFMNNSNGFDNELEIVKSVTVAEGAVRDLKLYVHYKVEGRIKNVAIYKNTPVLVDMDKAHLDTLKTKVALEVVPAKGGYKVMCEFIPAPNADKVTLERTGKLPMTIPTRVGNVTVSLNPASNYVWKSNRSVYASIYNPHDMAEALVKGMNVSALSKTTTIATISHNDILPERGIDFIVQMAEVYNRQANIDKNQIAVRTEEFINQRLEKINAELGGTDEAIEKYKRNNNMLDIVVTAEQTLANADETEKKLTEIGTQLLLLENIKDYMSQPDNKYKTLPSNVGLTDPAATSLITQFNNIALQRNHMLSSASELSPKVKSLTAQLDDLSTSLKRAINQSIQNIKIERNAIQRTHSKYSSKMAQSPEQERILTEIGRQQTVKSSLYIMLLQKREENSIELAATADKGKLIDVPVAQKVKPKGAIVMLLGFILGLVLPFGVIILREMLRFRVEGHDDIAQITKLPIIADIAVANEKAKTKGEIVVRENRNDQMEEIFRGMRTNLQFMLKEDQNVIMFTSSTSGEGKTFVAANLAVSFALLGKKVLLVGLDIRRPRLAELFEFEHENRKGISRLLTKDNPTWADIQVEITPSGINKDLDTLTAGPIPPNPAELVSRASLDTIFEILRKEYDYVIVDTAPVGLVTDTMQIGRVADVTVVVCRADYTEKAALADFNGLADEGKLPNMCLAINGIDMSRRKYGYAYGYGRYGKYSKYGYGKSYGGRYGYHSYGTYRSSHYGNPDDDSIKK